MRGWGKQRMDERCVAKECVLIPLPREQKVIWEKVRIADAADILAYPRGKSTRADGQKAAKPEQVLRLRV